MDALTPDRLSSASQVSLLTAHHPCQPFRLQPPIAPRCRFNTLPLTPADRCSATHGFAIP